MTTCSHGSASSTRPISAFATPVWRSTSLDPEVLEYREVPVVAVGLEGQTRIDGDLFYRMLQKTMASPGQMPLSTVPWTPHIHLAIHQFGSRTNLLDGAAPTGLRRCISW